MKILKNPIFLVIALLLCISGIWLIIKWEGFDLQSMPSGANTDAVYNILPQPFSFSGSKSFSGKTQEFTPGSLSGKSILNISYDLNGVCLLNGPASSFTLRGINGRTFNISLADYGINCSTGTQVVSIPMSDFAIEQPLEEMTALQMQFWSPLPYRIEIKAIKAYKTKPVLADGFIADSLIAVIAPSPTPTPDPNNKPPVAIATATTIGGTAVPLKVEFRGYKSYDPEKDPLTYHWKLGDGNSVNEANANHTYFKAGKYTAQFSVSDGTHITMADPIVIQVGSAPTSSPTPSPTPVPSPSPTENQPPVAIATSNVTWSATAPLAVELRGYKSYDPEKDPLTYRWVLGDGSSLNSDNANHTYFKTGTYVAQFSVSDGIHTTFAAPITITIGSATPTPPPAGGPTPIPAPSPAPSPIAISSTWIYCATEHQNCTFTGAKEVRYGANGSYLYKIISGGTPCTNAIFGDPIYGTLKQCHYRDTTLGAIATTPTPQPTGVSTPYPILTSTDSWPIRSVSSMKITKDVICSPRSQTFVDAWVAKAIELGVNYIAVETPYDNPSCGNSVAYTKMWVDTIHAKGLNVWHRHMPLAFEGIYNTPKNPTFNYISLISSYIKNNPSFFKGGDIFTPIPEPQNGGIAGITYCPQNICIFSGASSFNAWLRDAISASELAFAGINLGGKMKIGYYGFDGFVAWGDNNPDWDGILEAATIQAMGNITIDHYPEIVGDTMENDLNELQAKYPNIPIIIGEWGTITNTDLVGQVNRSMQAALRPGVVGFNYWHMGMGGNEALINDDLTNRPQYEAVKSFFTK